MLQIIFVVLCMFLACDAFKQGKVFPVFSADMFSGISNSLKTSHASNDVHPYAEKIAYRSNSMLRAGGNEASDKVKQVMDLLKTMTLLEANHLVKEIETTFGVDTSMAAMPMTMAMPAAGAPAASSAPAAPAEEEKTAFEVILTQFPEDKKISVLKVVRSLTGLGLKESKDIVDGVPKTVKAGVTKDESEKMKKELEAAGGKVTIK